MAVLNVEHLVAVTGSICKYFDLHFWGINSGHTVVITCVPMHTCRRHNENIICFGESWWWRTLLKSREIWAYAAPPSVGLKKLLPFTVQLHRNTDLCILSKWLIRNEWLSQVFCAGTVRINPNWTMQKSPSLCYCLINITHLICQMLTCIQFCHKPRL